MAAILAWIEKRIKGDWLAEMALREWTRLQDLIHEAYLQIPGSGVWPIRMLLQQGNLVESDNGVQYEPPIALQRYLFVRTYRGPWPTNSDCALCGCRTQRDFSPTNMFYLSLLSDWREKFVLPDSQFLCSEGKIQRGDNHSCAAFIERCCLPFASKRSFLRKYEEFAALHIEKSYQYINQNATLEYLAIGDFYRLLHGRQMTDFISSKPSFISHNVIGDRAWLGVFEHSAILAERGDCSPIRHHTNTVGNNFKTLDDFIKADVDSRIASGQVPANDRLEHERRQWANISAHVRCCPDQFRVGPGPGEKKRQVSWDRQCKMLDICQSPYIARTTQAARDAHVDIESATSDQYSQFHIAGKAAIPLSHFERAFDAAVISSISGYEFGLSPVEKKKLLIWEHRHAKKGLPTQLRPLTERKVNPSLYGPDRILEDIAAEGGDAGEMKRRLDEVIQRVIVCSADGYVDPFAELVDTVLASDPDHYYAGKEFFLHSDDTKLTYTPSPIYAVARAAREALHQRDPTAEIRRLQSIAKRNPALKGYDASPERLASLRRWSAKDAVLPIPTLMQVDEYREKHTKKVPFLDVLLFFGLEKVQQAGIDTRTREEGRG
ncbi:hypothetical protein BT96DRAFT_221212 [Gymnopus androsaceus JB14]|uniref:Uncharacterized protein n=1 Tax=Gymnopus androsaceus JB14 TaxID=1447944 RepID=A0A6A4ICM4_9AGAR|nr:hypothetical protein BT96DRAFT_221212 [Gymnopus androsaceus JB14]